MTFNTTATVSGYLPDSIYYCWFLPAQAGVLWQEHYESFDSLYDFEAGFIQNIMGNYLSFIDIYNKITVAAAAGDYQTVVYQVARLVRRLLDFDSMQNSGLYETTMRLTAYVNYFARLGDDSLASDNVAFE